MKKMLVMLAVMLLMSSVVLAEPRAVYLEGSMRQEFIASGWMGDYGDLKLNINCNESPRSGNTCIKLTYSAKMTQGAGWAGIYWQTPPNNWGDKKGKDLSKSGITKITFWARGEKGGEKIAEFKSGGITGEIPDSYGKSIMNVELNKAWSKFTIDLRGEDFSNVNGAFCIAFSKDDNPNGFVIYIDDIIFE